MGRLSARKAISKYWSGIMGGGRVHSVTVDRASVAVDCWELRAEAVAEIGPSAMAQIESLVLLDEGPLEAVDSVALE